MSAHAAPRVLHNQPLKDLLHPTAADTKKTHKLKRLVQAPNSCFIDVRCNQCLALYVARCRHRAAAAVCGTRGSCNVCAVPRECGSPDAALAYVALCRTTMFSHAQTVVTCTG